MILREATIKYKGYDPNDLTPGSSKRICVVCDHCGRVRYVRKRDYSDLCQKCTNEKLRSDPIYIKKYKDGIKRRGNDPEYRKKMKDIYNDPEWKKKQKDATLKSVQTPEWKDAHKKGILKRSNNLEWVKNVSYNMRKVQSNPEYQKLAIETRSKNIEWARHNKLSLEVISSHPEFGERISAWHQDQDYDAGEWTGFIGRSGHSFKNCIFINEPFPSCHRHHMTETIIICIPADLHNHIWHNLDKDINMYEINMIAIQYLLGY